MSSELLKTAVDAARTGGRILVERFAEIDIDKADLKGRNDYVTQVDLDSEAAIVRLIRERHPEHQILAEEGGLLGSTGSARWIIDPLDGTTNYIHRFPVFAVSVAVEVEGRMAAAAVFDPCRDELFSAARGQGAWLGGRRLNASHTRDLARALVLTGFPFKVRQYIEDFIKVFRALLPAVSGIRRCGSAALDLAYVAAGRADAFWEFGLSPWDVAAGALLIEEAGGRITDVDLGDRYLESGNVVASNSLLHGPLQAAIAGHFPTGYLQAKAGRKATSS